MRAALETARLKSVDPTASNCHPPRDASRTIDLADFSGQTFLQALQAANGIYAKTVTDAATPVTIASPADITDGVAQFDPKVAKVLYGEFTGGEADFTSIAAQIQGKSLSSQDILPTLTPLIVHLKSPGDIKFAPERCGDISLLASSSGTLVQIDADHYFHNIAFETTNHPKLVNAVLNLTPIPDTTIVGDVDGDLYRRVFVYMSSTQFADTVKTNATPLTSAVVALLKQVRKDSAKITTYIQSQP